MAINMKMVVDQVQFNIQTMQYSDFLIPFEQKIYETKPDLDEEESLELASMLFFDSLKLQISINDDNILTQATIDRLAINFLNRFFDREIGFETERKFRMKLKSVINTKADYYSQKFSLSFTTLLKDNVDLKKEYERGRNTNVNTVNEATGTGDSTNKSDDTRTNNVTRNTGDKNFTRDLLENTPDERLNLTSNSADGSGVINKASQIQEHKTTNNQDLTGNETSTGNQTGSASYNSKDNLNSDTTGVEKENYDDSTKGYDFRNVTQGKVYQDYLNSLQNVFEEILEDCDKCFLQIWV